MKAVTPPATPASLGVPGILTILELFKPVTWFPPMWAFACGAISVGVTLDGNWFLLILGLILVGPMVCATSQAVNDWFDRHVDAINEPQRPIPSGRMPGQWGLYIACGWTVLSLAVASFLGKWGFGAAVIGLLLAWAYSAPPLRLKRNGWWGNAACGLCYEGLAWITGAAVMLSGSRPNFTIIALALLYSLGAHGIMTLNDFKSIEGDEQMGINSLPVLLGVPGAALCACVIMLGAQCILVALLCAWHKPWQAMTVLLLVLLQGVLMRRFLKDPIRHAVWYSGFGIPVFVSGMMVCAFAVRGVGSTS